MALVKGLFRRAVETGEGYRRLDAEKVRLIRKMLKGGATLRETADRFGVGRTTIGDIRSGKNWVHVD